MNFSGSGFLRTSALALGLVVGSLGAGCEDTEDVPIAPASNRDGAAADASDAGDGSSRSSADAKVDAGGDDGGPAAVARRPNILLLIADDLGYSDIGAFGGEIKTPHLDALASEGRILTDHHTAATCSPTRSMLFSGTDHHLAGLGTMAEVIRPEQVGKPGYEGYLNERSFSIAELLRDAGYHTYQAGKWHLGLEEERSPRARGFESSFALLGGAGSHFAPVPGKPVPADNVVYREDGKLTTVPEYFYSSNFYADKLIAYIGAHAGDGKPFFGYAAFTAPHWPLQAPSDFIDRYAGQYDVGYEAIRARRLARQKELGVIPAAFEPNPGLPATPDNPSWEQLSADQKKIEARRMEIYAAMVENLDHNIGRIIQYLRDIGEYDNTLIFFQSDNGAEGGKSFPDGPNSDNGLGNLGKPLSNVSYGRRWAEVSATPFRLWKAFPTEGGVLVPAIARLPRQTSPRSAFDKLTHVSDLAPTFLELAGIANPGASYQGRAVNPITGLSLLPVLEDRATSVRGQGDVLVDELFGRRYVRRDQWKLTWVEAPWGNAGWQLYDLAVDRAEAHDLAAARPEIVAELAPAWTDYVARVGVVLPDVVGLPGRE
jgi:arylsulfatase A-like enzyme